MEGGIFTPFLSRRQFMAGALAGTAVLAADFIGLSSMIYAASPQSDIPPFRLPRLPYSSDALSPFISKKTIEFHYGKHHQGYIDKINSLVRDTEFAKYPLEEIIKKSAGNPERIAIFNNAAQSWNHTFYWKSMKPKGVGGATVELSKKVEVDFGSLENFKRAFTDAAVTQFGSGWAWVVVENGSLKVVKTSNADTPLAHGQVPLITIDVWEHAYYLDYQNRRADYIAAFMNHLVNWDFVAKNLARA